MVRTLLPGNSSGFARHPLAKPNSRFYRFGHPIFINSVDSGPDYGFRRKLAKFTCSRVRIANLVALNGHGSCRHEVSGCLCCSIWTP